MIDNKIYVAKSKAPKFLWSVYDNCETIQSLIMYTLYELDAYTDGDIEAENRTIKTKSQFKRAVKFLEQLKTWR